MVRVSKLTVLVAVFLFSNAITIANSRPTLHLATPASEIHNATHQSQSQPPLAPAAAPAAEIKTLSVDVHTAAISGRNNGFVSVNGINFYLNGQPWHCAGTNAYYAAITDRLSAADVDTLFRVRHISAINFLPFKLINSLHLFITFYSFVSQVHSEKGATVVRVFAHSDGPSTSNPIQPSLGVYNENALQRLDLVLYSAAKYGIRLILPFTNYEPFLGGIQWYAEQVGGSGADKELFYTDSRARDAYVSYVRMLLNRKNTLNGIYYKQDPTIFALELMNEPHTRDEYEKNRGLYPPGKIVGDWIRDMAAMVKGIDSQHILLTGEEGYRTEGTTSLSQGYHVWINNGFKGVDFARNCADPNIDACTVHAYPDNWGYQAFEYQHYGSDFLKDRAALAHSFNKPIVTEEYGMRSGFLPTRDELFRYLQNESNNYGYACSLVWSVSVGDIGSSRNDVSSYTFKYGEDGSAALAEAYSHVV